MELNFLLLFSHPATESGFEFACFFVPIGFVGLLLGIWRGWASLIWLTMMLIYLTFRISEISWLYSEINFDLYWLLRDDFGQIHLATLLGLGLSIAGLFIKKLKYKLP